jgi:hypothetical protein
MAFDDCDFRANKSPRAGETAEGMADKESPLPATSTIHRPSKLPAVEAMRLECGATVADLVASHVEDAIEALLEAAKTADRHGDRDVHRVVTEHREPLQYLMAFLAERSGS